MAHVAHQCICMQYLLELAKQLETDPRACISSFFTKIQVAENICRSMVFGQMEIADMPLDTKNTGLGFRF